MDITLDITDDVALIRFDDGKKNAFTLDGIKNLTGAFDEAEANAKAIVLTGRPGSFCAGFDLATMMGDDKDAVRELGQGGAGVAPIPEPTTALLLTLGLAGLGMRRRG